MTAPLSPIGDLLIQQAQSYNDIAREAYRQGKAESERRIAALEAALAPFVAAYLKHSDPIGDSDLYPEQPRSVHVTLGDCRKAARCLVRGTV